MQQVANHPGETDVYSIWLEKIAMVCEQVAEGDLEARVIGAPMDPHLHRIAVAINRMLDQADAFVREARVSLGCASKGRFHRRFLLRGMKGTFRVGARMINHATGEMARQAEAITMAERSRREMADELESNVKTIAQSVASSATKIRQTAHSLSSAAEKTTVDAIDVAHASLNCSDSVKNVASSTEQLAVAFGEIETQAYDSAKVAHQAVAGADRINTVIKQLDEASCKIGGVIRIISQIARQTNLLALNATIEAARSGEAGRGFAVVASEVKHLAQQTASATEEIETEVNSIQAVAAQTAVAITGISSTIHTVDHISKMIATAVNSQREATTEISKSVQEAARATHQVTTSIDGVSNTARQASEHAVALLSPSDELLGQASMLGASIDQFLASIRGGKPAT